MFERWLVFVLLKRVQLMADDDMPKGWKSVDEIVSETLARSLAEGQGHSARFFETPEEKVARVERNRALTAWLRGQSLVGSGKAPGSSAKPGRSVPMMTAPGSRKGRP
jgi:hypothetical protein